MINVARFTALAILSLAFGGCGEEPPSKDPTKAIPGTIGGAAGAAAETPEAKVRATFQTVLALVMAGDAEKLAPYVVHRGPDEARNWKVVADWTNEADQRRVKGVFEEVKRLVALGEPAAGTFKAERQKEGVWHVLETTFGAKRAVFAFLPIGDGFAIGDID